MSLIIKIKELAKSKGYTFASLERELGFGSGSIRKWDTNIPSADKLLKVAELLGVSVDYLLKDTPQGTTPGLDEKTAEILSMYSQLSDEQKKQALSYLEYLAQHRASEDTQ